MRRRRRDLPQKGADDVVQPADVHEPLGLEPLRGRHRLGDVGHPTLDDDRRVHDALQVVLLAPEQAAAAAAAAVAATVLGEARELLNRVRP